MGSSNENSAFGAGQQPVGPRRGRRAGRAADRPRWWRPARCPWPSDPTPAARFGSRPSFCGIVGLKPTYGRVSRYGLIAYGSSLDQIGPMTRTVRQAGHVLAVLAGPDPRDATTVAGPRLRGAGRRRLAAGPARRRARALLASGVDDDVRASSSAALATMVAGGATLHDIDLPHAAYAIPTYYLVATAEASANLARYDGVRFGHRAPAERRTPTWRRCTPRRAAPASAPR